LLALEWLSPLSKNFSNNFQRLSPKPLFRYSISKADNNTGTMF
jgi:hypothetical protein